MADFSVKRNDTAPDLVFTLRDALGAAVNLTGVTAQTITVKTVGGAVKFTAAVTVTTAASGLCKYSWSSTDTDTAGEFIWEVQVTYSSGRKQTFPTLGSMTLHIDPDADAA